MTEDGFTDYREADLTISRSDRMSKFLEARAAAESLGRAPREYLTAKRHVTVAELLSLGANPIVLVPAPGPGKLIVPLLLIASGPGGAGYTGGSPTIAYDGDPNFGPVFAIDSATGYAEEFLAIGTFPDGLRDAKANSPLVLSVNGGELVDGDYPIDLRLEYEIIEL